MQSIHITTLRKILSSPDPIDIRLWTRNGEIQSWHRSIHPKYTHITKLPDFVGVKQLHSSCAFVEVIFEGYAAVPFLDLTAASPEADVDGLGAGEDFAEGGDVD